MLNLGQNPASAYKIPDGYARINTLSREAYNESTDLKKQVEDYKRLNGYYPKVVITDKIYGDRKDRNKGMKGIDLFTRP